MSSFLDTRSFNGAYASAGDLVCKHFFYLHLRLFAEIIKEMRSSKVFNLFYSSTLFFSNQTGHCFKTLFGIFLLNDVIFFCEGLLQTVSFLEVVHGAIGGFCKA